MKKFKNGQQFISKITGVKFTHKEIYDCADDKETIVVQKWQTINKYTILKNLTKFCKANHTDIIKYFNSREIKINDISIFNQNAYEVAKMSKLLFENFENEDVESFEGDCIYSFEWISGILLMFHSMVNANPQYRTDHKLMCNLKGFCERELNYKHKYNFLDGSTYGKENFDWELYRVNFIASFLGDEQYETLMEEKVFIGNFEGTGEVK